LLLQEINLKFIRRFRSSLVGRFVPETAVCFANEGGNKDFGSQQKNPYKDLTTPRRKDKDGYPYLIYQ
jgi:hypothetical protein